LKLPPSLRPLFWNCDPDKLELDRSKTLIILEVLARGSINQYRILKTLYEEEEIASVFRADVHGTRTLPAPVVYLFSGLFLSAEEFNDYKIWHKNPLRRWEQRRICRHDLLAPRISLSDAMTNTAANSRNGT